MKRTITCVIAAIGLLVGSLTLTAQPASAGVGYVQWNIDGQWGAPTCYKWLNVFTTPYGYGIVQSTGYAACTGADWYDNGVADDHRYRVVLENVWGQRFFSGWIYPSSPHNGIDQYVEIIGNQVPAKMACIEAHRWNYYTQQWNIVVQGLGSSWDCVYA
jgi:hypothetical protein